MAEILLIETATKVCSVGLLNGEQAVFIRESYEQRSHAELITVFINEVIQESGIAMNKIDAVAVSMGPGSYTGLRIGVSTAKGICYAMDKPLIAIDTLQAMAAGMMEQTKDKQRLYAPMIDARRMEVYTAIFDAENEKLCKTEALIVDENAFQPWLSNQKVVFFGDGSAKCKPLLAQHTHAHFVDDFHPSVRFMAKLAQEKFKAGVFENTAYFEPYYLKDFIAAPPRVKGLR